jgi:CheY-like chemotaxis protein
MQTANTKLINKKILIVDDDQFSILLTQLKLRNYCNQVDITVKNSVSSVIDYLGDTEKNNAAMMPDLILLETAIEEAQGWDLVTFFEQWGKGTRHQAKLVILTSSQFFSDFRRSKQFTCVGGFLIKPLQMDLLIKLMDSEAELIIDESKVMANSLLFTIKN